MINGKIKLDIFSSSIKSLFDIPDITKPTISDGEKVYFYYDGHILNWDKIRYEIKEYKPGSSYKEGEVLTNTQKSALFITLKNFTATDIISDINNGNIKVLTSNSFPITFKQVNAYNKKSGDTITIPLTKPNLNYDRLIFVLQKQDVSAVDINPFTFDSSDTHWNYNSKDVLFNSSITLNKIDKKDLTNEGLFLSTQINLDEYKEISSIDIDLT